MCLLLGVSCVDEYDEVAAVSACLRWAGPMLSRFRSCWMPCRDDCTFSAWSKFTECTGCGSRRTRKRTLTGEKLPLFIKLMSKNYEMMFPND